MLTAKLVDFSQYLHSVGFTQVDKGVHVVVEKMDNPAFVFYSIATNTVHVDYKLTGDIGVILREYSHHIIVKDMTNISDNNCLIVEYAIAEYFSASYLDDPRIGITRDLSNTKILSDLKVDLSNVAHDDVTSISAVLAGALWETRSKLGHEPADRMIAEAWLQTGCTNKSLADFQRNLPKVVAAQNGPDVGHEIENLLRNRGFTG
jgi:hypothetical protein